jgi:NAD(P)H-flavin reductase/hemoglobin-like flavoprotein
MLGGRHLPGTQEASGSGDPAPQGGLLAWWQRRSWRMDLAVLARVRDGLKRLDAELGFDGSTRLPPGDVAGAADEEPSAPPLNAPSLHAPPLDAGAETVAADPPAQDAPAGVLPDAAITSIRETFAIVAAAGEEPASYFYGRLFVAHPQLRDMFPPAMDAQRDRLLRALVRIVEGLTSPEDLVSYLSQLGHDHRKYSVEPAMYDAVGEALIATLRAYAGPAFTADAEDAWVQAYQAASGLMIRAAEDDAAFAPAYWTAEVVGNEQRQPGIAVLTVAPDQPLPYLAGQHVTVQTPRWPRVWRPYSVASRPREDGLMTFHVRAVPGGWVSNALVRYAPPGQELILGPALGTMTLGRAGPRDLLCVAGGTGLAPIKAIIEQAIRESSACPRQIFLFYGARNRDELYDLQDLYRLADAYPRFLLTPVTSDDPAFDGMQGNVGRVAARYLPLRECAAYVAGPPSMVRETIRVLARAGIPQEHIHYDDALLAEDKRLGPRPAQETGDTGNASDTGNAGTGASSAASTPQDGNPPDGETDSETDSAAEGEPPEREQVSAGVLAARHDTPPG